MFPPTMLEVKSDGGLRGVVEVYVYGCIGAWVAVDAAVASSQGEREVSLGVGSAKHRHQRAGERKIVPLHFVPCSGGRL